MRTAPETMMIAADLKAAGFATQIMDGYNAIRVTLTRKVNPLAHQIRIALDRAGYEDCQYSISTSNPPYVRAIGPE